MFLTFLAFEFNVNHAAVYRINKEMYLLPVSHPIAYSRQIVGREKDQMHKPFLLTLIILWVKSKVQKLSRYFYELTPSSCDFNWWKYQLWFTESKCYMTLKGKHISREVSVTITQQNSLSTKTLLPPIVHTVYISGSIQIYFASTLSGFIARWSVDCLPSILSPLSPSQWNSDLMQASTKCNPCDLGKGDPSTWMGFN